MNEQETSSESVEGVEVQPDTETDSLADELSMDSAFEPVEESEGVSFPVSVADVEDTMVDSGTAAETPGSLASDRVEEIVDAVLQSDRVTALLDSFEYTVQTVAEMASAVAERQGREEQEPIVVVDADDLLDRLEARQAESAQAAQVAVRSSPMDTQAVAASMTKGGELVLPEEGEVTLDVIEALIESLISFFTEDGTEDSDDLLTSIKGTVEEIAVNVEPHLLMETHFEDYTVTEGLFLVVFLWFVVLNPCIKMIKGGFSWLLS